MSGMTAGKRRTRRVIQPVNVPSLASGEDPTDTRIDRALADIERAVNELIGDAQSPSGGGSYFPGGWT